MDKLSWVKVRDSYDKANSDTHGKAMLGIWTIKSSETNCHIERVLRIIILRRWEPTFYATLKSSPLDWYP